MFIQSSFLWQNKLLTINLIFFRLKLSMCEFKKFTGPSETTVQKKEILLNDNYKTHYDMASMLVYNIPNVVYCFVQGYN